MLTPEPLTTAEALGLLVSLLPNRSYCLGYLADGKV